MGVVSQSNQIFYVYIQYVTKALLQEINHVKTRYKKPSAVLVLDLAMSDLF